MDHSPPVSSVHGILQAGILEWAEDSLLQGIFSIHGSNPGLPHCRQILYCLSLQGNQEYRKVWPNIQTAMAMAKRSTEEQLWKPQLTKKKSLPEKRTNAVWDPRQVEAENNYWDERSPLRFHIMEENNLKNGRLIKWYNCLSIQSHSGLYIFRERQSEGPPPKPLQRGL